MLQQKLFSNQTQPFIALSLVFSQFVLLQWMLIVCELQFIFFCCYINCSREKNIGFLLFQYRLVKTHREILWGYICWCLTKVEHSEGVYIGCYGHSICNHQLEALKYLKKGLNQSMFLLAATYNHLGAYLYGLSDLQAAKESWTCNGHSSEKARI